MYRSCVVCIPYILPFGNYYSIKSRKVMSCMLAQQQGVKRVYNCTLDTDTVAEARQTSIIGGVQIQVNFHLA